MTRYLITSLFIAFLLTASGCKKDKDAEKDSPTFTVKIEGNNWSASNITGVYSAITETTTVAGISGLTEQLQVIFPGRQTGSFDIGSQFGCDCAYINGSANGYLASWGDNPVGRVEITKYDTTQNVVSGTFYFDGYNFDGDMKRFTEGSFTNVPLMLY